MESSTFSELNGLGDYVKAQTDFFEAFKNYDEAGMLNRIQCLKYLALANMLSLSKIDPFDSQETKPYKNDPEITAMTDLLSAYQRNQIGEFEKILQRSHGAIMGDAFVRSFVEELLVNIRTQVLLQVIKPYTRLDIPFIARKLNVPAPDVEALLINLILDGKVLGKIDQVNQILVLDTK